MSIRNPDTMVVFATAPNKTAEDGSGQNSPFTEAMMRNIATPGLEVEPMMKRVTRDVVAATKGGQIPERLSKLTSEFVFNEAAPQAAAAAQQQPAVTPAADPCASSNPPVSCLWRKR